jgi:hypothetical protein
MLSLPKLAIVMAADNRLRELPEALLESIGANLQALMLQVGRKSDCHYQKFTTAHFLCLMVVL